MKKQDSRQRLVEVMSRLDKTFKPKLNEEIGGDYGDNKAKEIWNQEPLAPDNRNGNESIPKSNQNSNIISTKYMKMSVDKPIISDAITVISKIPDAIKFTDRNEFKRFLDNQQYFSAAYSHAYQSIDDYHRNVPDENSILLFETGHEIVAVWDDTTGVGYIIPEERSKKSGIQEDDDQMEFRTDGEYLPITTPIGSEDDKMFVGIVNRSIDSHLEGFTKSKFGTKDTSIGKRRIFNFHKSELPILLRRLEELGTEEALQWKADIENQDSEESIDESPMFGSKNVSQDTYDELQYDKSNMEDAMTDAFKTPEGYQMKNQANVGDILNTSDGDKVKVLGIDDEGNINVQVMHSPQTIEHFKKLGAPLKDFRITWSPVQFDSIVGSR